MLKTRGYLLIVILFAATLFLAGESRQRLDRITSSFRDGVQEIVYFPRGQALQILACGFNAPLADALYIKSLIYFAESVLGKVVVPAGTDPAVAQASKESRQNLAASGRDYTYELFDVVTDLSPRFTRAYQMGSVFLTSSASLKANLHGVDLLDKGIAHFDELAAHKEKIPVDPRWLFHLLAATTYDINIASRLREAGDIAGAAAARESAATEFGLAAKSPGAPGYVVMAGVGYQSTERGKGDLLAVARANLDIWAELHRDAANRGDKELAAELEKRADTADRTIQAIQETQRLETALSAAGRHFERVNGSPPDGIGDLVEAGILRAAPTSLPLDDIQEKDQDGKPVRTDEWLVMPDGSFKSAILSNMIQRSQEDYLFDITRLYRRAHLGDYPPDLETLVRENYIDSIPEPPLAAKGQRYRYDPDTGLTRAEMPLVWKP